MPSTIWPATLYFVRVTVSVAFNTPFWLSRTGGSCSGEPAGNDDCALAAPSASVGGGWVAFVPVPVSLAPLQATTRAASSTSAAGTNKRDVFMARDRIACATVARVTRRASDPAIASASMTGEPSSTAPARRDGPRVKLWAIAREFTLIGATGFGGYLGLLVHRRVVERRRWLDEDEFSAALEAAGIAPGGTSTALLVEIGRRLHGVRGVAVATTASLLPGTVFVIAAMTFFQSHQGDRWVQGALEGAAAGGVAVLIAFLIKLWQVFGSSKVDVLGAVVVLAAALVLPVIVVLVISIPLAYVVVSWHERRAVSDAARHEDASPTGDAAGPEAEPPEADR